MKSLRILILLAAVVAVLMLLVAGPGTRLDIWSFSFGFTLMRWALFAGLGAAVLGVVLLLVPAARRGGVGVLAAAVVLGLGTAAVPWSFVQKARSVPPIHDISTDLADPPAFETVAALRADAPNPPEYAGEETAEQQREAYPDIQTFRAATAPAEVYQAALATARGRGWAIVAADEADGRIEATDTTFWFGFKDDVVIRIRADDGGSAVDVRSKSRVGRSDIGANAARIRAFLDDLEDRLDG
jgi:uncharacterized protein (DUF1499 family)